MTIIPDIITHHVLPLLPFNSALHWLRVSKFYLQEVYKRIDYQDKKLLSEYPIFQRLPQKALEIFSHVSKIYELHFPSFWGICAPLGECESRLIDQYALNRKSYPCKLWSPSQIYRSVMWDWSIDSSPFFLFKTKFSKLDQTKITIIQLFAKIAKCDICLYSSCTCPTSWDWSIHCYSDVNHFEMEVQEFLFSNNPYAVLKALFHQKIFAQGNVKIELVESEERPSKLWANASYNPSTIHSFERWPFENTLPKHILCLFSSIQKIKQMPTPSLWGFTQPIGYINSKSFPKEDALALEVGINSSGYCCNIWAPEQIHSNLVGVVVNDRPHFLFRTKWQKMHHIIIQLFGTSSSSCPHWLDHQCHCFIDQWNIHCYSDKKIHLPHAQRVLLEKPFTILKKLILDGVYIDGKKMIELV